MALLGGDCVGQDDALIVFHIQLRLPKILRNLTLDCQLCFVILPFPTVHAAVSAAATVSVILLILYWVRDLIGNHLVYGNIYVIIMNHPQNSSVRKSPSLVPMILHTPKGDHKILVSESTQGAAIISHIQTKIPRESKVSVFVWIKYKGAIYPLHRDLTAKYLAENYREQDGQVHLQLQNEDSFGSLPSDSLHYYHI